MPTVPNFRTIVYAAPAPNPPKSPIKDGIKSKLETVGFTTNRLPPKAPITRSICAAVTFSFKNKKLKITTKKGDILFSIEASAKARWSMA